jgi:hypothetical protein
MKKHSLHWALSCVLALSFAERAAADAPKTLEDAFTQGKISLNVRARYEGVEQTNLMDADAYTIRTRLGFTTAPVNGLKAMVEFENIASPDGDKYSQAGINPGGAGHAVVADPLGSEINQAWLSYTMEKTTATFGRQRIVYDNARFVGDVAWRQNQQTYDGFTLQDKTLENLTLNYAYLYRIERVFGDKSPQGRWNSDSHLFNASYSGFKAGTIAAYSYLLDFKNAAVQS